MMKSLKLLTLFTALPLTCLAQVQNAETWEFPAAELAEYRYNINIPGLDGYQTLKCDFHMHTVFSDGQVWPAMRVTEAWNQGLDAIAITDHIEVRPNKAVLQGGLNRSNEIARERGQRLGILVVNGTEITRAKPLGHINALFIQDVEKCEVPDPLDAVEAAASQGAFLFWNHPGWPDKDATMYPAHKELIVAGKIRGAEVFNGREMYPKVLDYCRDNNLAFMANSDLHVTSTTAYPQKLQRPMTLVFAKERTLESLKEALFAGRTLACFNHHLVGKEDFIREIVRKSLSVKVIDAKRGLIDLCNNSDITYSIRFGKYEYSLPVYANHTLSVTIPSGTEVKFTNCLIGRDTCLTMKLW